MLADAQHPLAGVDDLTLNHLPPLKGLDLPIADPVTLQAQDSGSLLSPPAKFPGSTEAPFAENSMQPMPSTCLLSDICSLYLLHPG